MSDEKVFFIKKIFRQVRWQIGNTWLKSHPQTKVIGIAGSVGKTTTKDILALLLAEKFKVIKTKANLDPEFNLPLTALKIRNHDFFVAELGISHLGEMDKYLDFAHPQFGILTRLSLEHSEFFGSLERSASEEIKLLQVLPENGFAVVNGDDPLIRQSISNLKTKIITYGFQKNNDYQIANFSQKISQEAEVQTSFTLKNKDFFEKIETQLLASYNASSITAAVVATLKLGLTFSEIKKAIQRIKPMEKRLNVQKWEKGILIDDTYNSSPVAVEAAVDLLLELSPERNTLILADMLELGDLSAQAHFEVGKYAKEKGIKNLIACGDFASDLAKGFGSKTKVFQSKSEIIDWIKKNTEGMILVKGSRGTKMEEVVEELKK